MVRHLRPPPLSVRDRSRRSRSEDASCSTRTSVGCARCHGVYDGKRQRRLAGRARRRRHGPRRVSTSSRTRFIDAFDDSPIAAEGALAKSRGYAATPLTGVWANYPYLHNGSVPTLHHLLGPVSERPRDLRGHGGATLRSRRASGSGCYSKPRARRFGETAAVAAVTAEIATGSTPGARVRRMPGTTCGRASGRTRTAARSSNI